MGEEIKHQVIESVLYSYITELHNKYVGFMRVKEIDIIHHLMYRCGKTT